MADKPMPWIEAEGCYRHLTPQEEAARKMHAALRAIVFQVIQGKVLERDACITQAREAMAAAEAAGIDWKG